jgi:opacity protein-like surface antigen
MSKTSIPASGATAQRLLLVATMLLSAAPTIQAQAVTSGTPSAMSMAGNSYIGLVAGPSDFTRLSGGLGTFTHEDHATAYGVEVGNYFPGQNIGIELAYTNFGQVKRGGGTTKAEGATLSLVGRMPINTSFNLLGKVGATYGNTEVTSLTPSIGSGSASGFDWSYGVGAELIINPQWSALVQYSEHYLKFAGISSERVAATTLGVRMRF